MISDWNVGILGLLTQNTEALELGNISTPWAPARSHWSLEPSTPALGPQRISRGSPLPWERTAVPQGTMSAIKC